VQFTSLIFLFLFMPVTLVGWYGLNRLQLHKIAILWLITVSLFFYGYAGIPYLFLMMGSLLVNYIFSLMLDKVKAHRKILMIAGIVLNLTALGYYKYRNFFFENINYIFKTDCKIITIALPLGISFFTLQQIAFLIDRYREDAPHYDLMHYAAFVLFFPKLMSGPIPYHDEFMNQLDEYKGLNYRDFTLGLFRFVLGMSKKILLADVLSVYVNYALENVFALDFPSAWLTALAYSLELYFDFSGYCDMALVVSGMLGFTLPENFNAPYQAKSVKDFWRRWHITLTRFLTKYIYIPLGGSRKGNVRRVINILIVFAISGLWHGASWNYVIWGMLHGVALTVSGIIHKRFKENWLSHGITMIFVVAAWAVFRIEDMYYLRAFLPKLISFKFTGFIYDWCSAATKLPEMYVISKALFGNWPLLLFLCEVFTLMLMGLSILIMRKESVPALLKKREEKGFGTLWITVIVFLFVWCIISLSEVSTFLYFTF